MCSCVDRYCVIFYPTKVLICARTAFVIIGVIWLLPVCIQIPWILLYTFETKAVGHSICYLEYNEFYLPIVQGHFLGVVFLTCYLLPLCLITFFYAMVGVKVCRRDVSGIRGSKTERNIQASKIRIVRMLGDSGGSVCPVLGPSVHPPIEDLVRTPTSG